MQRSTDTEVLASLLAAIDAELERAVALRHELHRHPELAHEESATAAAVCAELPVPTVSVAGTGRIARVGPGDGAAIGVRAELDALPIAERTGAPFSARGGVMHACGHDVHMAALVALVRAAHALADELPAPLLAIFQPSEEAYPSGAELLAREKLDAVAPAAIVAAHVHPDLPWRSLAIDAGVINASSDHVEITIEGEPSHAGYPHRGRDPVLALAQLVVALHALAARRADPRSPVILNVGVLDAPGAENLIPQRAHARAGLRAYRHEDRVALRAMVEEATHGIAAAHGCRATLTLTEGEPPLENDPELVARARELLAATGFSAGEELRSYGSDDFAFFAALAPLAMAFVGLAGAEGFVARPLHHPELLIPDEAVGAVARAQAMLYLAAAASPRASAA